MNEFSKLDAEKNGANTDVNCSQDSTDNSHINNALNDVLSDNIFLASPKMSAFLRYVVQETMAGNADRIKAYTVAVDALGKPPTFDPQNDPSVRVLANRLRTSLDNYYANNPEQALFIALYRGSYIPHFIDSSGCEHVQAVAKNKQTSINAPQRRSYEQHTDRFALSTDTRRNSQCDIRTANRVNSWLMGGGKKYV